MDAISQSHRGEVYTVNRSKISEMLRYTPGPDRLPLIESFYTSGLITADDLRALLAEWWTDAEYGTSLTTQQIVKLFRAAGFVTDAVGVEPPTCDLVIFRGSVPGRQFDMSWSQDAERAAWFAEWKRLFGSTDATVYTTQIHPQFVLGIFHSRQEQELLVDPVGLHDVVELDQVEREGGSYDA